jgi:hypothetical protein
MIDMKRAWKRPRHAHLFFLSFPFIPNMTMMTAMAMGLVWMPPTLDLYLYVPTKPMLSWCYDALMMMAGGWNPMDRMEWNE